jgi:predicted nucleotidyltransferase
MLDKAAVRKIAEQYTEEVKSILQPVSIILFGSYVNGEPNEWSDIDIAVVVHDYKGDWLETAAALCGLTRKVSIDIDLLECNSYI